MDVTPGWYPDPEDTTNLRWWDGTAWTEHRQPIGTPTTAEGATGADDATGAADEATGAAEAEPVGDAAEGELTGEAADLAASIGPDADAEATIQTQGQADLTAPSDAEADAVDTAPPDEAGTDDGTVSEETEPDDIDPDEVDPADVADDDMDTPTVVTGGSSPWIPAAPPTTQTDTPATGATPPPPPPPPPPAGPGAPPPGGPGAPPAPAPTRSRKKPILIGFGVLVVLALVAAGAFVLLGGDDADFTWEGEAIADPQATIDDADDVFLAGVAERNGAVLDDSRCYFVQPAEDGADDPTDVFDYLRCGPVLFVDDDPDDGAWITYALDADENSDGDLTLSAADQPQSGQPSTYDDEVELLVRPDDETAPAGHGGLDPPEPPEAEPGILLADDPVLDDIDLDSALVTATGRTRSVDLDGFAEVDRYGTGDEARRPAEGERFLAFETTVRQGDELFYASGGARNQAFEDSSATISLDVDGEVTELAGADVEIFDFSRFLVSVPEEAEVVDIVLDDSGVAQRISLLTQAPAPDNIDVLARTERQVDLGAQRAVPATLTDPAGNTLNDTFNVTIRSAALLYYVREVPDRTPSSPNKAFLVIHQFLTSTETGITEADGIALEPGHLHLRVGDETIEAINLAPNDGDILVAFEVPGDFTSGTLVVRGSAPSGEYTVDLGNPDFRVPVEIEGF